MKETRFTYEGVDEKRMYNRDLRERHDTQAVFQYPKEIKQKDLGHNHSHEIIINALLLLLIIPYN